MPSFNLMSILSKLQHGVLAIHMFLVTSLHDVAM